jgi:CubicO group peptidase (beta-lactamase class C family)
MRYITITLFIILLMLEGLWIAIQVIQPTDYYPEADLSRASLEAENTSPAAVGGGRSSLDTMDTWPTSTPEEQGINSQLLMDMFDFIAENQKNIHSLLIVRNGRLVIEAYFNPYRTNTKHHMASASKSVVSMLIGIAIKDGYLQGVDQRMGEFFPETLAANIDPRKKDIKLKHLITMTTGIHWQESSGTYWSTRNTLVQMTQHEDWTQFILDQPLVAEPGEKFNYNSGASHLLSAIVQKATGSTAAKYAEENLFKPLGIDDYHWESDPSGITIGGWGLMLTPRDMAKLGYLYLRNGYWEEQIIPATWVAESTQKYIDILSSSSFRYKVWERIYRLLRREPPFMSYAYGYQWGIPAFGGYAARGIAGQAIFVIPELDMVVVFTGGLPNSDQLLPERLMEDYIIKAALSTEPLPLNQKTLEELNATLQEYAHPKPDVVPPQPSIADAISKKRYVMDANIFGFQWLSFKFCQKNEGGLKIGQNDKSYDLAIGLDGVYRIFHNGDQEPIALKGYWADDNTFVMDMLMISSGRKYEQTFNFNGDRVRLISRGIIEDKTWRMRGHVEN